MIMNVLNIHQRRVLRPIPEVFREIAALGTAADRIWPEPAMPFQRTDGPMNVGVTRERHGGIEAVLDAYEDNRRIVWRARMPFLQGTHSFEVQDGGDGTTLVRHAIRAHLAWWFVPVWWLYVRHVHDRILEGLLDRLADSAELAERPGSSVPPGW
jgi:hypothetical protein